MEILTDGASARNWDWDRPEDAFLLQMVVGGRQYVESTLRPLIRDMNALYGAGRRRLPAEQRAVRLAALAASSKLKNLKHFCPWLQERTYQTIARAFGELALEIARTELGDELDIDRRAKADGWRPATNN